MSKLTRRFFITTASVVPFALWLEGCKKGGYGGGAGGGGGTGPTPGSSGGGGVRYDARSSQGQAMLQTYAQAVKTMKDTTAIPEGDPTSWVFQWYTHGVKGSTNKAAEIARIYPSPSPDKDLAQAMWNTCEAHWPGGVEDYFLPWHRMFVYYFESIIRKVSGDNSFTLPYWNYSSSDPSIRGVIPPEFRMPGDPTFGSLYVDKRNTGVNSGQSIAQGQPNDPLSLISLAECIYSPNGAVQGFNQKLDFGLHGNVHVLTGNGQNMGSVPWAAGDPIFWMHHCNIDRLWASWNAAGRTNPTTSAWKDKTFVFANSDGMRVDPKVGDFSDIAPLGYSYDKLEPVPACPTPALTAAAAAAMQLRARATAPVPLGDGPVRVSLGAPSGSEAYSLSEGIEALDDRRLYVMVKGLEAEAQPGVLYHVYLGLPADADPAAHEESHVGTINFFNAPTAGMKGMAESFVSFDVTDIARRLKSAGSLGAETTLTVAPAGQPAGEAGAKLGELTLVEQ